MNITEIRRIKNKLEQINKEIQKHKNIISKLEDRAMEYKDKLTIAINETTEV